MTRYSLIAIALLLASCDQRRGLPPIDNRAAEQQAEAKEAGAKEARDAVQLTRLDTLESRVSRLEAEIAAIEAKRGAADDINSALAELKERQAAPPAQPSPGKPPASDAGGSAAAPDTPGAKTP